MTTTEVMQGVECTIVWGKSEPTSAYISFGTWDEDNDIYDSFGVRDDCIFYYFDADEQKGLVDAIANGKDLYRVTREWYIDLTDGVYFAKNTESN